MIDFSPYPNFTVAEFTCSFSGKCKMQAPFMERLQALRTEYGKPMVITSGFRDITHPVEAAKPSPGYHNKGLAADIACDSGEAYKIVELAFKHGFTGIGVNQKGSSRFVHLDLRPAAVCLYSY